MSNGVLRATCLALLASLVLPSSARAQCSGDVDGDGDVDLSDLCTLLTDLGCEPPDDCVGDLDGDGSTTFSDLGILLADWGCPDGDTSCDELDAGTMSVSVVQVDNRAVRPGDDPMEPDFDGGDTHFTFDLQVQVDPGEDWCGADAQAVLTNPNVEFFRHASDSGGWPPDSSLFGMYPALEFDSYWCGASVIPPGDSGVAPYDLWVASRTAVDLSATWYDHDDTGDGTFTIARYTIVLPSGSLPPDVVPAGTGGDVPVIGTITGSATNCCINPSCVEVAFDIIRECNCPGDIDGDCDTDQSDLGALLAAWGSRPGDYNWDENADLDGDGHVFQSDLGVLLGNWRCGVPAP